MLYSIETGKDILSIPYEREYQLMKTRLSQTEYSAIFDELTSKISGDEIHTSSWIPGADWTDTVYAPLYEAANQDEELAAKYFGLFLWVVVMEHPETWSSGRYEKDGIPIRGRTYFRVTLV